MNLLITSISAKVPLLKAAAKAVRQHGGKLHGADADAHCIGRHFVDRFWAMPSLDQLSVAEIIAYCRAHAITALLPTRDGELPFFSAAREPLSAAGVAVMVPAPVAVACCRDKVAFADALIARGLPAIPTSVCPLPGSALMVKERFGAGSVGAAGPLPATTAVSHGASLANAVYQPFIEGVEYSIDLYRDSAGCVKGTLARRRLSVIQGESRVTRSERMPELERLCAAVANELELYGHAVIQAIVDPQGQPWLIECNPRVGGASTLAFAMGLESIDWFLREAAGERLDTIRFRRHPDELTLIRHAEDMIQ